MNIEELESKYQFQSPELFHSLWNDGMLDWMGGRTTPFGSDENWAKTIYPTIKDTPPLLLHTGGFDFELLTPQKILDFKFDEFWDMEKHDFIPFARLEEGATFALYTNLKSDGEPAVVCIWNDMNETEVLAKSFEDFIFRKMIEAVYDVDKDELSGDYKGGDAFVNYREDILKDLNTIKPYLPEKHVKILEEIYNRDEVMESMISYSLISRDELKSLIETHLSFEELDSVFEHEI